MGRILLAFRAFFLILFDREVADRAPRALLGTEPAPPPAAAKPPEKPAAPPRPKRSEAVSLLEALQREARFVDFIMEPLGEYSDEQVGAAARDVHRDCGKVLERLFGLKPVLNQPEMSKTHVPEDFDAGRFRLTGKVEGQPPFEGRLVHHGWEASVCNVPEWTGSDSAARVVAPAEVEVG